MANLTENKVIHFIGIGGISMSAIAKWCLNTGYKVTGSDKIFSSILTELTELGADIYVGLKKEIVALADIVVYTSAISEDNEELITAKATGKEIYERHEFLGILQKDFKKIIAVSGTHGKTTVTSLIAAIFKNADLSFTAHIGGEANDVGGNFYSTGNDILITEACEYRQNFLTLFPTTLVILNIESDHPDCFNSLGELYDIFAKFVDNVQNNGFIVVNTSVEYAYLHISAFVHLLTFGKNFTADFRAENIIEHKGIFTFDIIRNQEYYATVTPRLVGKHNVGNALAAVAVADSYGIDKSVIIESLEKFKGVKRRFEYSGEINGATVINDYAHHPSEIRAVINASKNITDGEVKVYFQPHTFTRTAKYFNEFCQSLMLADEVNLLPTYPARENKSMGKSAYELYYSISEKKLETAYFETMVDAAANILKTARPKDVILILGAGDIVDLVKIISN